MNSNKIRQSHIKAFALLSVTERLEWAFQHAQFLQGFLTEKEKKVVSKIRKKGKRYIEHSDITKNNK